MVYYFKVGTVYSWCIHIVYKCIRSRTLMTGIYIATIYYIYMHVPVTALRKILLSRFVLQVYG
jgi:hypothetical protein